MELIDSHCHLDCLEAPIEDVISRAKEHSVVAMICIGSSEGIEPNQKAVAFAERFSNVWASIGFHPHDAGKFSNLEPLKGFFEHKKVVAIGETGLDCYRDWSPFELQKELFRNSIRLARELKKPLIIHARDAREDAFKILKEERAHEVGGVFHCYAEDAEFARRIQDLNFFVSFTGVVTFKNATNIHEAVRNIPIERMLVETDCPYMAPVPFRGKPSEPMHTFFTAQKIAELKELSLEQAAQIFTANTKSLFRL